MEMLSRQTYFALTVHQMFLSDDNSSSSLITVRLFSDFLFFYDTFFNTFRIIHGWSFNMMSQYEHLRHLKSLSQEKVCGNPLQI